MIGVQDEQAIHAIVKDMEIAWNRGEGVGFAAHMTDDAECIDALGRRHTGRDAIADGHEGFFATTYKGSKVSYAVEKIRGVGPLSAIAFVRASLSSGPQEEGARPTLMLQKQGGSWKVAAFQNTRIA